MIAETINVKYTKGQSPYLTKDMAGDSAPAGAAYKKFGSDMYGYSPGCHNNDYKPIGGAAANVFDKTFTAPGGGGQTLDKSQSYLPIFFNNASASA